MPREQAGSILFSPDPPSVGVGRAGATIGGGSSGSRLREGAGFSARGRRGFVGHVCLRHRRRLRRGGPAGRARPVGTIKRGLFAHEDSAPLHRRRPRPLRGDRLEPRASEIRNPDGTVVFRQEAVTVPSTWSSVATDVLAQKYFRRK